MFNKTFLPFFHRLFFVFLFFFFGAQRVLFAAGTSLGFRHRPASFLCLYTPSGYLNDSTSAADCQAVSFDVTNFFKVTPYK